MCSSFIRLTVFSFRCSSVSVIKSSPCYWPPRAAVFDLTGRKEHNINKEQQGSWRNITGSLEFQVGSLFVCLSCCVFNWLKVAAVDSYRCSLLVHK